VLADAFGLLLHIRQLLVNEALGISNGRLPLLVDPSRFRFMVPTGTLQLLSRGNYFPIPLYDDFLQPLALEESHNKEGEAEHSQASE
jgi:hypothetical protein